MLGRELPGDPAAFLLPEGGGGAPELELPDDAGVCSCNNVSAGTIRGAVTEHACTDLGAVKACTRAGHLLRLVPAAGEEAHDHRADQAGGRGRARRCASTSRLSRAQLYDAIRVSGVSSFTAVIERFGTGRGCDICRPTVASILATTSPAHVLEGERAALQDTNDHVMANLQKDGSYSVVPRIPGGEVTPEGLIAIGSVAQEFGLYTKITGGQRIDLFGARIDQLPVIWQRLVDAGFESGHAYGKSLRTVKSCVGSTWCRFGVQDSVALAVMLELRYRGLRSPHKIKLGVSGCARECAEARGKDVGVIATDKGWNVYVGGNGGFTPAARAAARRGPRHRDARPDDRPVPALLRPHRRPAAAHGAVDRRGRGRPGRCPVRRPGGLARHLRRPRRPDGAHVDEYEDEWRATLEDPEKLRRFASFVNAPQTPDPSLAYVPERGQSRPATADERAAALRGEPVLVAGTTLEVRS